ncbi:OLC1v1024458C1 [Oldenlandia corymbosa var. corymbosa]|uniref:OLC1v1024458C1 n=1 Tax=Oldenlandia corymbosa var. corymbosa TaxID=529605 RepID=A0AAV1C5E5_OLDCO|nr:OLC1v1024458C1 [Oldenlandia corymbosa var. corymbosa]
MGDKALPHPQHGMLNDIVQNFKDKIAALTNQLQPMMKAMAQQRRQEETTRQQEETARQINQRAQVRDPLVNPGPNLVARGNIHGGRGNAGRGQGGGRGNEGQDGDREEEGQGEQEEIPREQNDDDGMEHEEEFRHDRQRQPRFDDDMNTIK